MLLSVTAMNAPNVSARVCSVSWIPSEAVTGAMKAGFSIGLTHYDPPPPGELPDLGALGEDQPFRFANVFSAWADFDGDRPVHWGQDGGVRMGETTVSIGRFGASFAAVAMPDLVGEIVLGDGTVTFTQTCGGRTALPLPRKLSRPPFVRLQAPLVWTTLALTLYADGRTEVALIGASPFPRHWVYDGTGALALKAGRADWSRWLDQPSWRHTPWGDLDSPVLVTAAESALERELSRLLMGGSDSPEIRSLATGSLLARQGEPGDSLFLLLDGVLRVSVDGTELAELGPGAVLGERAVLERGRRTATLTAATPIRVAVAPAAAVDPAALHCLAAGHRREIG